MAKKPWLKKLLLRCCQQWLQQRVVNLSWQLRKGRLFSTYFEVELDVIESC